MAIKANGKFFLNIILLLNGFGAKLIETLGYRSLDSSVYISLQCTSFLEISLMTINKNEMIAIEHGPPYFICHDAHAFPYYKTIKLRGMQSFSPFSRWDLPLNGLGEIP
jgi:hypothetical protein